MTLTLIRRRRAGGADYFSIRNRTVLAFLSADSSTISKFPTDAPVEAPHGEVQSMTKRTDTFRKTTRHSL
jgi:hypothetical protein